jgi:hypothetical protein
MCVAVKHDEPCEESIQCSYSNETACENGICQCKSSLQYNGERCVGKLSMYKKYASNRT